MLVEECSGGGDIIDLLGYFIEHCSFVILAAIKSEKYSFNNKGNKWRFQVSCLTVSASSPGMQVSVLE